MKRFWDQAAIDGRDEGLAVLLDGRPMRIPGGAPLVLRGRTLAEAVAAEWQAAGGQKGGEMSMEDVPLTRLAGTAQNRIALNPAPVARELARYAETDLLCYRVNHPEPLATRQELMWQPWLDWLADTHAARLHPTTGITHHKQDPAALACVHDAMHAQTPEALAALGLVVPLLGSAVLGLALAAGAMDAVEAHALAVLDEMFEVDAWGEDDDAARRRAGVAADVALAERFLRLSLAP